MNVVDLKKEDFAKFSDFLEMGFYRVTREGKFLECHPTARKLLGIPADVDLAPYSFAKMYAIPAEREMRIEELEKKKKDNKPLTDTLSLRIDGKNVLLFDICWFDKENNLSGFIRKVKESNLLRSLRAIEKMPTGFYHIEYADNDEKHERERLTQCNDRFAHLLGFKNREDAIGKNMVKYVHIFPEIKTNYFKDLMAADKKGEPLQKYPFRAKRVDTGEVIHLSIDVHLVKDSNGKVIGREGTVRDVSEEIKLREKVKESRKRLDKTTEDINKFIHTFLHPVVKFAGNSELLHQVGDLLQTTGQPKKIPFPEDQYLGGKLMEKLTKIRHILADLYSKIKKEGPYYKKDGKDPLKIITFKDKLEKIINLFDYSLKNEESELLLTNTIRDTAIWVLDELKKINFQQYSELEFLTNDGYIEFLQRILFGQLVHITEIMKRETEVMKNGVEALRRFIGLQKERQYSFMKADLRKILEENIERFKPIFLEKGIEIENKFTGNLDAVLASNDIDRLVCNLLHNAGKYSYPGPGRFVKIKAREIQSGDKVECTIENFGIPIKKEEIESGYIFKFGNRGELAFRSDRDGTGVGLADAKETVEAHGGELKLTSEPVRDDGDPPGYKVPYKTTVTINLPKKVK